MNTNIDNGLNNNIIIDVITDLKNEQMNSIETVEKVTQTNIKMTDNIVKTQNNNLQQT